MFKELDSVFIILTAIALAFILALWISLIIWTIRDIRLRTKDRLFRFLAALSVIVFNFPGFLIYLILRPKFTFTEHYQTALEEEALLQSIEGFGTCPNCGHQTQKDWKYCPFCEFELVVACESCGKHLKPNWITCPECGTHVLQEENLDEPEIQDEDVIDIELVTEEEQPEIEKLEESAIEDDLFLEEEEFDSFQDY